MKSYNIRRVFFVIFPLILLVIGLLGSEQKKFLWIELAHGADRSKNELSTPSQGNTMSTSKEIATRILNLSPEEFFAETPDFSKREFSLADENFEGLAINAPASIDIVKLDRLPVALATLDTSRRLWEVLLGRNMTLVAWQDDSGSVFVGNACPPPKKIPALEIFSRQPPEPRETPPYAKIAKILMIEARERLNLPWQSGRFSLVLINYDRITNVVEVDLKGQGEPEKGKLLAVSPAPASQGTVKGALPYYDALPETPRPPDEGLEFTIAKNMVRPDRLTIFGSFAINAREQYMDRSGAVHRGVKGKRLPVVGVVPATLLVFWLDCEVPKKFDWGIPVYGDDLVRKGMLKGYFAIDALQGSNIRLKPGKYFAYIISNNRIFGPKTFTIPGK